MSRLRSSETIYLRHETQHRLHPLVLTAALPRVTAHRAATIEPTIQEPINRVRALNSRSPSNSTTLCSIRNPSVSSSVCPKIVYSKSGRTDRPGSLRSEELPALRTQVPDSSKSPMGPQLLIDGQTALQQLLTARVLIVLVKD
jgi:hypothetical protein